jgi:hypothetical protein
MRRQPGGKPGGDEKHKCGNCRDNNYRISGETVKQVAINNPAPEITGAGAAELIFSQNPCS